MQELEHRAWTMQNSIGRFERIRRFLGREHFILWFILIDTLLTGIGVYTGTVKESNLIIVPLLDAGPFYFVSFKAFQAVLVELLEVVCNIHKRDTVGVFSVIAVVYLIVSLYFIVTLIQGLL